MPRNPSSSDRKYQATDATYSRTWKLEYSLEFTLNPLCLMRHDCRSLSWQNNMMQSQYIQYILGQ